MRAISSAALGQPRDRRHRAARDHHAREQRQPGADEHADEQEQLDARDGRLGVGDAAPVLDVHLADSFAGAGDVDVGRVAEHAVAVDVAGLERGGAEGRRFGGFGDHGAAEREDPDHRRALGLGEILERRVDADDLERDWG